MNLHAFGDRIILLQKENTLLITNIYFCFFPMSHFTPEADELKPPFSFYLNRRYRPERIWYSEHDVRLATGFLLSLIVRGHYKASKSRKVAVVSIIYKVPIEYKEGF